MTGRDLDPEQEASPTERALVLLAIVTLYAAAVFGTLFLLVLIGAPQGDRQGMAAGTIIVLVSLVTALGARASRRTGRVAMAMALAVPAALAAYVWAGG